jgi:hypothetical protein
MPIESKALRLTEWYVRVLEELADGRAETAAVARR